jgi:hypothetical protein
MSGKGAFLKRITSKIQMRSVEVGEKLDGTSPPSVFVGAWNYPKVYVGPMLTPDPGDTSVLDTPEAWIPGRKTQNEIIRYRLDLVRGKHMVGIKDLDNKLVQKLQEISLAKSSVDSEAEFRYQPKGFTFNEEHTPFGPSAPLERFDIGNVSWEQHMQTAYYDTDLKASEAVVDLYNDGVMFSQIQKAFSTGTMGIGRNRRMVPTRWSITAVDTALANHLYDEVMQHEAIDRYLVYEFSSLNNRYLVLLTPTPWQYEWIEAFIHVMGESTVVFGDSEVLRPKKEYSSVGGCYYSCKFAVLEALARMRKQAGAVVLREAYEDYVPLGVFNVRENVRNALLQRPLEFESLHTALGHMSGRLELPLSRFMDQSRVLKDLLSHRQTTLSGF